MNQSAPTGKSPIVPLTGLIVDDVIERPAWQQIQLKAAAPEKRNLWARIRSQDWIVALFYMPADIVCWVVLYALVGYVRRDAFFASPFEFVLVDGVALLVILQTLYIIGGYNRNTETRGLAYTAE